MLALGLRPLRSGIRVVAFRALVSTVTVQVPRIGMASVAETKLDGGGEVLSYKAGGSKELFEYVVDHMRIPEMLTRLMEETDKATGRAIMSVSPDQGQFLAFMVRSMAARKVVEVGTFTGYSSLCMATALGPDGSMDCCDVSEEFTSIAKKYWAEAGVSDKIRLHLAPATETLEKLLADGGEGTYDLAFIDADKSGYDAYYELCLKLLRPGGVVLVDNTLWHGRVIDMSVNDDDTKAIRALNDKIRDDDRVTVAFLKIADGVMCCHKK